MGLFGRNTKDVATGGIKGSALIQDLESADFWDEHSVKNSGSEPIHLTDFGVGNFTYRLQLDVTLDDHRPVYRVVDRFKIPRWAEPGIDIGITIPVFADPANPNELQINWGEVPNPAGGGDEISEAGAVGHAAQVHSGFPDASRQQMVEGWVNATKQGMMSREAFDQAIDGAVGGGLLTTDEAEAARSSLS